MAGKKRTREAQIQTALAVLREHYPYGLVILPSKRGEEEITDVHPWGPIHAYRGLLADAYERSGETGTDLEEDAT